jgi:hypothetical protein
MERKKRETSSKIAKREQKDEILLFPQGVQRSKGYVSSPRQADIVQYQLQLQRTSSQQALGVFRGCDSVWSWTWCSERSGSVRQGRRPFGKRREPPEFLQRRGIRALLASQTLQPRSRAVPVESSLPTRKPANEPTPTQQQPRQQQPQQRRLPAETAPEDQELPRGRKQLAAELEYEVRSENFELLDHDDVPLGGRLRYFANFWRRIAPRKDVMNMILGASIPFVTEPCQDRVPAPCRFDKNETDQVRGMVNKLLKMDLIEPVSPNPNQFVSQLFLVTNKDLSKRAILIVKTLNQKFLPKQHFKMETLQLILPLIKRGDWFGSWDLRKGYFNVALHPDYHRFFCFDFENQRYQFKCLVMGLSLAPLFFTKIMSVLVQLARSWGIQVSVYLDDLLTRAQSFDRALRDHEAFGTLLQRAGFLRHRVKSVENPVQRIEHLVFVIDSVTMCIEVPAEKENCIREAVKFLMRDILTRKKISIRRVARVIGLLVSMFPAVRFGKLHYRILER